jgi:cytidylate kinase
VARRHEISQEVLQNLGEKNQLLAEIIATFSPRWRTDRDYFRLLCEHVVSLAEQGNVIILELGGACIARHLEDAHHIRLYASQQFKTESIATRLGLATEDAEQLIMREQRQRDQFLRTFLDQDGRDPDLYDLMINNTNHAPQKIAQAIASFVVAGDDGCHLQRKKILHPAEAGSGGKP